MRHIIPISGKDSLATALIQTTRYPDLPYEFMFNDVGCELPETYAWLDAIEQKTGWQIQRVGKNLQEIIESRNNFLPSPRARYCTRESKIEPMKRWIGKEEATIYYGLRADENRTGLVPVGDKNITVSYPLRDMGIDLQGVYAICDAQGLEPPSFKWEKIYEAVDKALYDYTNWQDKLSRTETRILFSGRSRANCFFCFFQRQYEFLWLFEAHPDLYVKARDMEKEEYTFQPNFRLSSLEEKDIRDKIFNRKVNEVTKYIKGKYQQSLFPLEIDTEIALTSCGLLCGK
jgi:hypothetical protein